MKTSGITSVEELDRPEEVATRHEDRWDRYHWHLIPGVPRPPLVNMALDEVLTLRVGRGERPPTIRVWGWDRSCVVLGRFQSVRNEVDLAAAEAEDVQVVRRISGGGAMFVEPAGAITYSIYAPESIVAGMTFPESYAFFDGWVVSALRELGVDAWYAPLNDITSAGGKIGGAAQARRGGAVLHHTTMAYDMNVAQMLRVLRIGKEKLSDKGVASADKRVGPLRQQTELPRDVIIGHLTGYFGAHYGLTDDVVTSDELAEAERLVDERFGTPGWLHIVP
ncbi:MAG: Lipoate-protein ligase A [uncultured Thermomicrobiales bacterium]|uniref:Lipoate-protein ligase A n=1 Tax=uncultured Thermomicrobiales bacterium TaxID=1645740 RepID=A0A6J4UP69_9BACT|nr:MAG: Lipoate-protein ligase A [uncultured Thermomicrobiales bacterium]